MKLVLISGDDRGAAALAEADLAGLLAQEGVIGGRTEASELRSGFGQYQTVYTAHVLAVWDSNTAIPLGCGAASRTVARRLGVRVPRGVDA